MLKEDMLNTLYAKRMTAEEFNFDALTAPSMYNFLSEYDLERLYNITTSVKYSSKVDKKIQAIRDILRPRGFEQFANGTNRMCFRYLEDTSFLLKVPYKTSGLDNGAREFRNQQLIKPFVAKTFEVHPSGIASMHERVLPLTNKEELLSVADDVFYMLTAIIGKYVIDDVGSEYFMNLGIRRGFGVVIMDYPDLFELDGRKLYCNRPIYPNTKTPVCGGLIDYDDGFSHLRCTKCGKEYTGSDLQLARKNHQIIIEGDNDMKVTVLRYGEPIRTSDAETSSIIMPEVKKRERRPKNGAVSVIKRGLEYPINSKPAAKTTEQTTPVKPNESSDLINLNANIPASAAKPNMLTPEELEEVRANREKREAEKRAFIEDLKKQMFITDDDIQFVIDEFNPGLDLMLLTREQLVKLFTNVAKGKASYIKSALEKEKANAENKSETDSEDEPVHESSEELSEPEQEDKESSEHPQEDVGEAPVTESKFIPSDEGAISNY